MSLPESALCITKQNKVLHETASRRSHRENLKSDVQEWYRRKTEPYVLPENRPSIIYSANHYSTDFRTPTVQVREPFHLDNETETKQKKKCVHTCH